MGVFGVSATRCGLTGRQGKAKRRAERRRGFTLTLEERDSIQSVIFSFLTMRKM